MDLLDWRGGIPGVLLACDTLSAMIGLSWTTTTFVHCEAFLTLAFYSAASGVGFGVWRGPLGSFVEPLNDNEVSNSLMDLSVAFRDRYSMRL